jgi:hypothetical protein
VQNVYTAVTLLKQPGRSGSLIFSVRSSRQPLHRSRIYLFRSVRQGQTHVLSVHRPNKRYSAGQILHSGSGTGLDVRELLSPTRSIQQPTFEIIDGRPDTFIITGDIDASIVAARFDCQVWPYMPLDFKGG